LRCDDGTTRLDTFGRFPATVPAIFTLMYLQAHWLEIVFYGATLLSVSWPGMPGGRR